MRREQQTLAGSYLVLDWRQDTDASERNVNDKVIMIFHVSTEMTFFLDFVDFGKYYQGQKGIANVILK